MKYRLKSNPTTIVQSIGDGLYQVVSTKNMQDCNGGKGCSACNATWMISRQTKENLLPIE